MSKGLTHDQWFWIDDMIHGEWSNWTLDQICEEMGLDGVARAEVAQEWGFE